MRFMSADSFVMGFSVNVLSIHHFLSRRFRSTKRSDHSRTLYSQCDTIRREWTPPPPPPTLRLRPTILFFLNHLAQITFGRDLLTHGDTTTSTHIHFHMQVPLMRCLFPFVSLCTFQSFLLNAFFGCHATDKYLPIIPFRSPSTFVDYNDEVMRQSSCFRVSNRTLALASYFDLRKFYAIINESSFEVLLSGVT